MERYSRCINCKNWANMTKFNGRTEIAKYYSWYILQVNANGIFNTCLLLSSQSQRMELDQQPSLVNKKACKLKYQLVKVLENVYQRHSRTNQWKYMGCTSQYSTWKYHLEQFELCNRARFFEMNFQASAVFRICLSDWGNCNSDLDTK